MTSAKTPLQSQIEMQTGYRVERVADREQMTALLAGGLSALYQSVFAEPPYLESFTEEEVRDCFLDFIDKKGTVFVACDDRAAGRPVAFVASIPLREKFALAASVSPYIDTAVASYFAEDGVDSTLRRQGLSGRMKQLLLEACRLEGMKAMLLRTSVNSYSQISAVAKAGGVVIPGLTQDVASLRLDGQTTTDKRGFYVFDMEAADDRSVNACRAVVRVRNGQDTAYVTAENGAAIAPAARKALGWRIKNTYPGIARVVFADGDRPALLRRIFKSNNGIKNGREVFRGRFYLSPKTKPPF